MLVPLEIVARRDNPRLPQTEKKRMKSREERRRTRRDGRGVGRKKEAEHGDRRPCQNGVASVAALYYEGGNCSGIDLSHRGGRRDVALTNTKHAGDNDILVDNNLPFVHARLKRSCTLRGCGHPHSPPRINRPPRQ